MTKQRILLVEDHEPNILVATYYLEEMGYHFDVAHDGLEAVDKFSASTYDAILMDIQLPKMDGMEASRQIRKIESEAERSYTPIVAVTGRATDEDKFLCRQAGMTDVLSKPFRREELENILHKVINIK